MHARLRDGLRLEIEDLDEGASTGVNGGNDRSGSLARLQRQLFNEDTTLAVSSRDDQVLVFSAAGKRRRIRCNRCSVAAHWVRAAVGNAGDWILHAGSPEPRTDLKLIGSHHEPSTIIHDRRPDSPIRPMPRHIGIILDGNRRHARKQGLSEPCEIYQRGAGKLDDVLNWSAELYIPAVTLWVFSTENLKRSWCALRPGTAHMLIHATMGPTG